MGRWVVWILILLAAGGLLWWAIDLGPVETPPYVDFEETAPEVVVDETGPELAGQGLAPPPLEVVRAGDALIRGIVVDAEGKPLVGVTVTASPLPIYTRAGVGRNRQSAQRLFLAPTPEGPVAGEATTDVLGAFLLESLESGRQYRVRARVAAPLVSSSGQLAAALVSRSTLRIIVEEGHALKVRVVDADGKGIQAWVQAGKWDYASARPWLQAMWMLSFVQTGADGRLLLPAAPAEALRFQVLVPGRGARTNLLVPAPTDEEVELRFEDASGATVEGRVTSTKGEPVVGAQISVTAHTLPLRGQMSMTTVAAVTDADGQYKAERLPAGAIQALHVVAVGFITPPALARGTPIRAEKGARVDIVLARGGRIEGRVLDGAGQPLPDAELQATRMGAGGYGGWMQPLAQGSSDAEGKYLLEDVALGAGMIHARLTGYFQPKLDDAASSPYPWMRVQPGVGYEVEAEGQALEKDVVLKLGAKLEGVVLGPEDEAMAGVVVSIRPGQGGFNFSFSRTGGVTASTDEEGHFHFEGLEPDQAYNLDARSETMIAKTEKVTLPAQGEAPVVELRMQLGGSILGLVLQDDGRPAAGAIISCNGATGTVIADASGIFFFEGVKVGSWTVQVKISGAAPPSARKTVKVAAGENVEDVELTLPAALAITGEVVDEQGKPMIGMTVSATLKGKSRNGRRRNRNFRRNATSGPGGKFEIRGLFDGDYQISGTSLTGGGVYPAGAEDVRLEYREPEMRDVEGRVLDPDGRPVARGQIQLWTGEKSKRNQRHSAAITGGRFHMRLNVSVDDHLDLQVTSAIDPGGRPIDYLKKRVKDLDSAAALEVRLERGLLVSGRVVDTAGTGLTSIQMRITKKGSNNYNWAGRSVTQTGEGGAWHFGGLQEGEFTISVTPGGDWMNPEITPVEAGDKDIVIKLSRGLSLAGQVLDPEGEPLPGAQLWLTETPVSRQRRGIDKNPRDWLAQYRFRVKTGADGRFLIRGLPERAVYNVGANGSGPEGAYMAETLKNISPGAQDLMIRLGASALIEGAVFGPNGEAVTSGRIQAQPVDRTAGLGSANKSLRGSQNTFKLGPLKPGRYKLTFQPRGKSYGAPLPIEVDAPSTGVRINLTEAVMLEGRLEGENVQGFTVTFLRKAGSGGARVARDGSFQIKAAPGWVGTLYAHKNGDGRYAWLEQVEVVSGQRYTLRLQEGLTISGQIEGLPYDSKGCSVYARAHNTWMRGRVDRNGGFVLQGLPPGSYKVQGWLRGGQIAPAENIEAGSAGVILEWKAKAR